MIEIEEAAYRNGDFTLMARLSVPAGKVCAIIGPSGSGKSTLLNGLAGFIPLTAGRALVEGRDITPLPPARRPVSLLFQDHNLFPDLTAAQNVGLGLRPALTLTPNERARVERALEDVGLPGYGGRRPATLSGGQRQRVAVARALLRERPVLLLDEPFAALGPAMRADMLTLTRRVATARGMAVLLVTHAPEDARAITDLTAFCDQGRIEGTAPTGDVFANPSPALARYLGAGA